MYNTNDFEILVNDILSNAGINKKIKIFKLINQSAKKWYDKSFENCESLEAGIIYGVSIDSVIDFEFKVSSLDSLLKSFLTKFTNKVKEVKTFDLDIIYYSKSELLDRIIDSNKDRVHRGCFYTTIYGIGFWAIFSSAEDKEVAKELALYLNTKGVNFSNEWSEARWVYRFVIKQGVEKHNELLSKFEII